MKLQIGYIWGFAFKYVETKMIELEQVIRDLAKIANPSEAKIQEILNGWLNHFKSFGIQEADYVNEFNATMRLRVSAGSISIVAPLNGEPI